MMQIPKIKAIVAEDIPAILEMICRMIKEINPEIEIVGKYTTLAETKSGITQLKPDVVLLDIQFEAEGKTAFDLLKECQDSDAINFQTIIITSHSENHYYAMAFAYKALHFVSKPIDKEQLKEALDRIKQKEIVSVAIQSNQNIYKRDKLIINTITGSNIVNIHDIVYFRTERSYTDILLSDNLKIRSSRNIGFFEEQVFQFPFFFRVHNGIILNINYLTKISCKTNRMLTLKEPFGEIQASKERFRELLSIL